MKRALSFLILGSFFLFSQAADARRGPLPTSANYRRGDVKKLMRSGQNSYNLTTSAIKTTKQGMVIAANQWRRGRNGYYNSFKWVMLPYNKSKPVYALSSKQARKLGLRPLRDAMREAGILGPRAKFAKGQPFKKLTFTGITNGTNKHAGTARSFLFKADMSKKVDGHKAVYLSVPMEKYAGSQTAWTGW